MGVSVSARRCALLVLLVPAVLAQPAAANGSRSAEICAIRATLHQAPGGAVVGVVHRGDVLAVLTGRRARRGWTAVQAPFGTRGWVRSRQLCRRGA